MQTLVRFHIPNKTIFVMRNHLLFRFFLFTAFSGAISYQALAQVQGGIDISGQVVSISTGMPLNEINISVFQSPGLTVKSDSTGNFQITVPDINATLLLSYPGFNSLEEPLRGRTNLYLQMVGENISSVSDNIPISYHNRKYEDLTESVSIVPETLLRKQSAESVETMIQGLVPGALETRRSGFPGSGAEIFIRGASSINASHKPLYIIDGFILKSDVFEKTLSLGTPYNPLVDINPEDVESITVLKDGLSCSMYGARAANGVILINTYQGSQGASTLDFTSSFGFSGVPDNIPLLDASQYRQLVNEIGFSPDMTKTEINRKYGPLLDPNPGERFNNNTNWQNEIFKQAPVQNYHLRLKGGDGISKYMFTVGYTNKNGIIENSSLKRLTSRFNLDYQITNKLTFSSRISYTNTNVRAHDQGGSIYNPINLAATKSPILEPLNREFQSNPLDSADFTGKSNPIAVIRGLENTNVVNRLIGTFKAGYSFKPSLNLSSTFGMDYFRIRENRFIPATGIAKYKDRINQASLQISKEHMFTNETLLEFNKLYEYVHNISMVLGASLQTNEFQSDFGSAINTPSDQFTSLGSGAKMDSIMYSAAKWITLSYFGNAHYDYNDKYFVSANLRIDGSSKFGQNNRLGSFPGAAIAWKLSSEPFLQDIHFINLLKIRSSYGISGSDNIGYFSSLAYYIPANYQLMGGYRPGNLRNPDLRWEKTGQWDAGLDLSVFKQRINLNIDYYLKTTTNLLTYEKVPWESGFDYRLVNTGKIQNRGMEFELNAKILTGDLGWIIGTNITANRNKILELPDGDVLQNFGLFESIARKGESLGSIYGYKVKGIYQTADEIKVLNSAIDPSGYGYKPFQPGDLIFEDINNDGEINSKDKTIIGSTAPKFYGGINSTLSFKGLSFFAMMNYTYGNKVVDELRYILESMSGYNNQSMNVLNRWKMSGDQTNIPRAVLGDPSGNSRMSSRWVEDGSYLRLKTITLSYLLPASFVERISLKKIMVYASGENLISWGAFKGYDPEFINSDALVEGIYNAGFPQTSLYMMGVKIGF
jgi:TonB-dependent starch-binding outer membrane protein SusC